MYLFTDFQSENEVIVAHFQEFLKLSIMAPGVHGTRCTSVTSYFNYATASGARVGGGAGDPFLHGHI